MNINITASRSKANKPSAGDTKICKDGVFVRRQRKYQGCYVVSNGRPVWDWERVNDVPEGFKGGPVIKYTQ